MNSNDFDDWNREAILQAALEYRASSESYRSELIHTETQLARITVERDRLRKALDMLANWDFSGRLAKQRMQEIARAALQEADQ